MFAILEAKRYEGYKKTGEVSSWGRRMVGRAGRMRTSAHRAAAPLHGSARSAARLQCSTRGPENEEGHLGSSTEVSLDGQNSKGALGTTSVWVQGLAPGLSLR